MRPICPILHVQEGSGNKNKKALRNVRDVKRVAHGTTDKGRKIGA